MKLLYEWVPDHIRPRRWMALAFYSAERNRLLFIAFPLNLLVSAVWWLQDQWARKANAPSWIEREVAARVEQSNRISRGYWP
jgi:hypothetical protein